MKAVNLFANALVASREWHSRLRVTIETFQANAEPSRAGLTVKPLGPHIGQNVSNFASECGDMTRSVGMRKAVPQDRNLAQLAELHR